MNTQVFLNELRLSRATAIGWLCAIVALALIYLSVFPSFSQDADAVRKILANMPEAFRTGLKIDIDTMLSFLGYYSFTMTILLLLGGFAAVGLGLSIFAREEQSKTTDFLLSKPVRRREVFWAKLCAGVVQLLLIVIVFSLVMYVLTQLFDVGKYDIAHFAWLQVTYFLIMLWLFVFGVILTQLMRIRSVTAVTLGTVFTFFVIGFVGALIGEDKLRYVSPFRTVDVMQIAGGQAVDLGYSWLLLVAGVVGLAYAYYVYTKRDVRSVS